MKSKQTPDIRFAGFTGNWEQRKLGELIEISSASRVHKNEWTTSGVRFFRSSDVVSNFNGKKNVPAFIPYSLYEELSKKSGIVKPGDILVTGGGSIGIPYLVSDQEPLYFKDADLIWLKSANKIDGHFLYSYFVTNQLRKYISSITHIGTISHYTIEQAKDTPIKLPEREEQIQIGNFFKQLDDTIACYQEELTILKQVKQGFMQKIFSQEVRFKDDNGEDFPNWKVTTLSKLLSIPQKEIENDVSKNKLLTVKLHRNGVQVNQNTDTLKIGSTNYYRRKSGQFIYGKQNFFNGAFDIIPDKYDGYLSSGDVPTLDINENKVLPLYLLYYMGREVFYKRAESLASGTGSKRIHEATLLGINISLPTMKEQQKIANFLTKLEDTIALHKRELDALRETKKAFLQKMFP